MEKSHIKVIYTKENAENITRGYLLFNSKNDYTPFIVCSNYKELPDGRVTWDWGHYCSNFLEAVICMYEDDFKTLKNNIDTLACGNLDNFTGKSTDEIKMMTPYEIREQIYQCEDTFKRDLEELFTKKLNINWK